MPIVRKIKRRAPLALFLLLLSAPAAGANAAESYSVSFKGGKDDLTSKLKLISDLNKDLREYPTVAALRRAARRDATAFDAAMTAAGYYLGETSFEIVRKDDAPPEVVFTLNPGPSFKITEYEILYRDEAEGRPTSLEDAGVKTNGSAAGADLRNVQTAFRNALWQSGYPAAEIVARRAIALPEKAAASAVFVFRSGPRAKFGEIELSGLDKTEPDYVRKLKTWETGEQYDRTKIVDYRDRLSKQGIFSSISVAPGAVTENGAAPILVDLEERKRRTIGAGVSFSTAEGPGGRLFFTNRNMFGRGETLDIEIRGSQLEQGIDFDARKPFPGLPGYVFVNFGFANETTDAFDARSLGLAGGLAKRWLDDRLETRAALALETSNVKSDTGEERTYFVSAPLAVLWDSENDLLNPTDGFRASLNVTPYTGSRTFTQVELSGRSRIFFGGDDKFTLAGRAAAGATLGNSLFELPVNKRFFAGGGGSVRGYAFQEAGPLNAAGDPTGGRSYATAGTEMRAMVTENIQAAAFVDAGTVMSSSLPDFSDRFFVGYGVGARYFTPIGPIRFDVAFPLDGRESDGDFQIYIALGQPF